MSADVRDLITLDDVMQELQLGPNGCVAGWGRRGVAGGTCCWQQYAAGTLQHVQLAPAAQQPSAPSSSHCCTRSGLLYCMEYLEDNLEEWLGGELQSYGDDDYLLFVSAPASGELGSAVTAVNGRLHALGGLDACRLAAGRAMLVPRCCPCSFTAAPFSSVLPLQDCPGQIELYSHLSVFKTFVDYLKRDGWQICVVSRLQPQQPKQGSWH